MAEEKILGIVTKILDFEDTSQIVTVLTHYEVITFIALGTRKITSKNRVAIQVGNIIDASIFRARLTNRMSKLKKAVVVKQPPITKSDTAKVVLEFIKYLALVKEPEGDPLSKIMNAYEYLGGDKNHKVKTFIVFNILEAIGQKQELTRCVECGSHEEIIGFEFFKGGYTCTKHTSNKRSLAFLKAISALNGSIDAYKDVDDIINKDIFAELSDYIKRNNFV